MNWNDAKKISVVGNSGAGKSTWIALTLAVCVPVAIASKIAQTPPKLKRSVICTLYKKHE